MDYNDLIQFILGPLPDWIPFMPSDGIGTSKENHKSIFEPHFEDSILLTSNLDADEIHKSLEVTPTNYSLSRPLSPLSGNDIMAPLFDNSTKPADFFSPSKKRGSEFNFNFNNSPTKNSPSRQVLTFNNAQLIADKLIQLLVFFYSFCIFNIKGFAKV